MSAAQFTSTSHPIPAVVQKFFSKEYVMNFSEYESLANEAIAKQIAELSREKNFDAILRLKCIWYFIPNSNDKLKNEVVSNLYTSIFILLEKYEAFEDEYEPCLYM